MDMQRLVSKRRGIATLAVFLLLTLTFPLIAGGPKIPLVKKKKSGPAGDQTFVGKIKSIDTSKRVLVVTTIEGDQEESYEYKKSVDISSAHKTGHFKISDLSVGMLVTLYMKSGKNAPEIYQILMM
ncbi:MAG: hypothetical protein PHX83_09390 [Acidobacteriia bacterium]|nr:hypothetical protein [Terriglobia bacterium]